MSAEPWIAALIGLILVVIRMLRVPEDRKRCDWFLAACVLALPANMISEAIALSLSAIRPLKLDQYVYQLDVRLFGAEPAFFLGRMLAHHPWLGVIAAVAYSALPSGVLVVFAAYLWRRPEREMHMLLRVFTLNLFVAPLIYLVLPACGPGFAFADFPLTPYLTVPEPMLLHAAPNCIPSVHMSTALLIVWFARRWRAGLMMSVVYLALIMLATLGTGQHYFIDLLAAFPYSALMLRLGAIEWRRSADREAIAAVDCY